MAPTGKRTTLLVIAGGVLLLVIVALLVLTQHRRGKAPASAQATPPVPPAAVAVPKTPADRMWDVMAGLAVLDQRGSDIPPDKTLAEQAQVLGATPDALLTAIQTHIALVPYEGSLAEPAQILDSGMANSLDRARLLSALLSASGTQTRIVSVRQGGASALATYATVAHAALPSVSPPELAAVQKEVTDVPAAVLPKLMSGPNLANAIVGAQPEQRLYWVQYQRSGQWTDLIPTDITLGNAQRSGAQVLSDAAESKLAWQVKLTVTNQMTGDSSGKGKDVLSYSAPASDLNALAITFLNRPDGSLTKFVPTLLVGGKKVEGTGFAWKAGTKELRDQLLKIDVVGPTEARHFVRVLVDDRGTASDAERGIEIASSAHITVLTGLVSDARFERAIADNLSQSARILFHNSDNDSNPVPANSASIPSIAVLDASHRYAGQLGEASKQLLAFQGRPAVALDRDFVDVAGDSLTRNHSFDLLDPGHSLYGIKVPGETLLQAAIDQSVVDALLEDWMANGANVTTSRHAVSDLLAAGAQFSSTKPPSGRATDDFGKQRPVYRLASSGQNGIMAGWRLDPGPQLVPILGDGSGGTRTVNDQMARVQTLCKGLTWVNYLVPSEVFPAKLLVGGIVNYDCHLAQAYVKSADVLNNLAAQIGGEAPPSSTTPDDVAKQIKEMTDGLIGDIVKSSISSAVEGVAVRGISHVAGADIDSIVSPIVSAGADYISSKIGGGAETGALSGPDSAAITDAVQSARGLEQAGSSPEQVEKAIQDHNHGTAPQGGSNQ
jgi:hypothetical protein